MNKKHIIPCATLCALLLSANISLADTTSTNTFSDLNSLHPNYIAVQYLFDSGIINGYSNGTFRPDSNINRVEFLKIALLSSETPLDITTQTGFSDVSETAWYAPYLKKAKHEGWIEGYPDGTFRPDQPINKVEALKIIGEIQGWEVSSVQLKPYDDTPINSWFTPFVKYAKDRYFLEEKGTIFSPDTLLSRAKISEILFRSYITKRAGANYYAYTLIKENPPIPITGTQPDQTNTSVTEDTTTTPVKVSSFEAVTHSTFDKDFFDDIQLTESFFNTFYKNEVYYFEGEILSGNYDETFVFLAPEGITDDKFYLKYPGEIVNNQFNIPVIFRETGNFKLGIILGQSGRSKVIDISVMPSLPSPQTSTVHSVGPINPSIKFANQKTTLNWTNRQHDIIKLTFKQGTKTKSFYFRQDITSFDLPYRDFEGFTENTVSYTLQGADLKYNGSLTINDKWSTAQSQSFLASQHYYGENQTDKITVNNFPEIMSTKKDITFTGNNLEDISQEAAIIKPSGLVEIIDISTSGTISEYYGGPYINQDSSFTFNYTPAQDGIYMIEINGLDGAAVFNMPVYINNGIPFVPDYHDLYYNLEPEPTVNLSQDRSELLTLINGDRTKYGFTPVELNTDLNNLAQAHTEDMIARNFFAHVNPDGLTPDDRRKAAGIPSKVGENISIAPSIPFTHYGLMQSGIHRRNILDPSWTKVGFGITKDQYGSLYVAQEFSGDPLDQADLKIIKSNITAEVNITRKAFDLAPLTVDSALENVANIWSQKMADEDFFSFTSPSGETLSSMITQAAPHKPVQATIIESNDIATLSAEIQNDEEIKNEKWMKMSIGLKVDAVGGIKATVIFTSY